MKLIQGRGKNKNIQQLLTKYFVALLLVLIGMTSAVFSVMMYRIRKLDAIENLQDACSSAGENIDLLANQLDTVVLNALNSTELKAAVAEYNENSSDMYEHNQERQKISSLLNSLKGFDLAVRQLSIYSTGLYGYGAGDWNGMYSGYNEADWYQGAVQAAGRKYISTAGTDQKYFSICRAYYDSYHRMQGIVEGRMYYENVFHSVMDTGSQYDMTVLVYDQNGNQIYPLQKDLEADTEKEQFPYYQYRESEIVSLKNELTGAQELAVYDTTEHMKFTVVMAVRTDEFLRPILLALLPILLLFIAASLAGLIMVSYLAGFLTLPIKRIYSFLAEGNTLGQSLAMDPPGIVEIDQLIGSINDYAVRSKEQTQKIIALNQQEIQAQMLALQSQMNPHFLYNSLASISEMAKEGMTDEISVMAGNISQILRIISSSKEQLTTIEEELELCDMYLECMKLRFGENLQYEFQVEDDMLDFMIPKLCIQLFAENAIKASASTCPPWKICVIGYIKDDRWYIEVRDNGPGFSAEVENHLLTQMNEILITKTLPGLQIEGMGILNIFIRFYLLDGVQFIFDFGNQTEGGAYIQVGRRIDKSTGPDVSDT